MVKTKHKTSATVISKSNDSQNSSHNLPNVEVNSDLPEEDSWVIVKKQKVNILIPRLPSLDQNLDHSQGQLCVDIPTTTNVLIAPPQLSPQKPHQISLAETNDNVIPLSPQKPDQLSLTETNDNVIPLSPQKPDQISLAERIDNVIPLSPKSDSQPSQKVHTPQDKATSNPGLRKNNFEDQYGVLRPLWRNKKTLLKFNQKVHKPSRAFGQRRVNSPGCTTILNKTMRASNLKIKILRAGGLRKWLSSLGLEQFEAIFRGKNISKFLVANLSMNKLKDMGYHAVGPRRKLIHAIECLC